MSARILFPYLLASLACCMISSCAFAPPPHPSSTTTLSDLADVLLEFPLVKGTTWVYSFVEYEPTKINPTQITTATYLFSDKVIDTQSLPPYFVAHIQHEEQLVKTDPDWVPSGSGHPSKSEFWYVLNGGKIYDSSVPPDLTTLEIDALTLDFDLPLVIGKSWCPTLYLKGEKMQDCIAAGKRTVVSQESHKTPAGIFTDCYKLTQDFNSGGVTQWFCNGVGIVAEKYDHAGTQFGFEETLIRYTKGSP